MQGVIQLLDSAHGRPLQHWPLTTDRRVTVGRSLDNDVVLADPFVSRAHAYIEFDTARQMWLVVSISQQQLVCDGKLLREVPLGEGVVFRLGPQGCFLRFNRAPEPFDNRQTMNVEFLVKPKLTLDTQQVNQDVAEIVTGEFFQHLQQSVQQQRARKRLPPT